MTLEIDWPLEMFRLTLGEGVLRNNLAYSVVNINISRGKMCQDFLVGIGDGSWCAIFKDKANDLL